MISDSLKTLVSDGFFDKELPSEFSSKSLTSNLKLISIDEKTLKNGELNRWTKLIQYSIPKREGYRRTASVVHPLHFISLATELDNGWSELTTHFTKSNVSLTTVSINNHDKKIEFDNKYGEKIEKRITNLSTNRYILFVDINRYYSSIYTHSIPWALHSKEVAKQSIKNRKTKFKLLGNRLDRVICNLQDGQTMGIPIGPSIFNIIQEIIGVSIDKRLAELSGKELKGSRYVDDMEYYFETYEEANNTLSLLIKILREYSLEINSEKTQIVSIPFELEDTWIYAFRKFKFQKDTRRMNNIKHERDDLKEYFSILYKLQNENSSKGKAKYALKKIRNRIVYKQNWSLYQSLLLQTALTDSSVFSVVFEIIENYKYKGYPINFEELKKFINSVIRENISLTNDYEILWALSLANKLKIDIDENNTMLLSNVEHPLINSLVMILNEKKLLHKKFDFNRYLEILNNSSLYDENWIFFYEACRRNWLNKSKNDLKNDCFFVQLSDLDVRFIESENSNVENDIIDLFTALCTERITKDSTKVIPVDIALEETAQEYEVFLNSEEKSKIILKVNKDIKELSKDENYSHLYLKDSKSESKQSNTKSNKEIKNSILSDKNLFNNWTYKFILNKNKKDLDYDASIEY